jgi:two-component system chemotaxis response regulator CheY
MSATPSTSNIANPSPGNTRVDNKTPIRIMVVDDMRNMRMLVCATLRQLLRHDVIECCDGQEALEQLSIHPCDLVISDVNMPRLDGFGLLAAVRSNAALAGIPFIMLTSRGEVELVKKAISLGANNYMVKPFNLSTMKRKIEAVIGPLP